MAAMAAKVAALEDSLTNLAHENALLKRRLFGSKTERGRTSELQLALGDLLAVEAKLQATLGASVETVGGGPVTCSRHPRDATLDHAIAASTHLGSRVGSEMSPRQSMVPAR